MKKGILKMAILSLIAFSFSSCKSYYYQVYDVDCDNMKAQDNSLVFENEDCKILYNLWSNNGELKFAMVNKTDRDIFVNMGQTFYTVNGKAEEYFQDRTYSQRSYVQSSIATTSATGKVSAQGFWGNNVYLENATAVANVFGNKAVHAEESSFTVKEKEMVCIPARCFKVFNYYKLNPAFTQTCDKNRDFPKQTCSVGKYTKQTTPYLFNNRIAYGFTKKEVADKHIDNEFWISAITNYSQKAATENVTSKTKCYNLTTSTKMNTFKIGGPNKFYKLYGLKNGKIELSK